MPVLLVLHGSSSAKRTLFYSFLLLGPKLLLAMGCVKLGN